MGLATFLSTFVRKNLECVATTDLGQSFIKNIDSVLWSLEKPAKYCIDGNDWKSQYRKQSSVVFWILFSVLQISRLIVSKILIRFGKNSIEAEDVVMWLQRSRKTLRSIRFRALQTKRRESGNINGATSSPTLKETKINRWKVDERIEYDLLEELMNRTYSENDEMDSTFTIGRSVDASMNCSSTGQSFFESPSKSDVRSSLNETLPAESSTQSVNPEPEISSKLDSSIGATDESTSAFMMTAEDSTSTPNEEMLENTLKFWKSSTGERNRNTQPDSAPSESKSTEEQVGQEPLNQHADPADALMSLFVQKQKDGKSILRLSGQFEHCNKRDSKSFHGFSQRKNARPGHGIAKPHASTRLYRESLDKEN